MHDVFHFRWPLPFSEGAVLTRYLRERQVPFFTAQAMLAKEPDPRRREALGDGTGVVIEEADELNLELNVTVLAVIRELGFDGYIPFWSSLKGLDYDALRGEMGRVATAAEGRRISGGPACTW